MANMPKKLISHSINTTRVQGLRDYGAPGTVSSFEAVKDAQGNIVRDKAGNPVLGKRIQ